MICALSCPSSFPNAQMSMAVSILPRRLIHQTDPFSGQRLDNGGNGTQVRFVIGVYNKATPQDIENDLQNGAQAKQYVWRDIGAQDANIPPLPQPDRSDGWATAARMFLSSINVSVDPCQDFFRFSCDNYIATHPLNGAPTQSTFGDLQTQIYANMSKVYETVDFSGQPSETLKLTSNMYKACNAVTNNTYQGPDLVLNIAKQYGGWPLLDSSWDLSRVPNGVYWTLGDIMTQYGMPILFVPNVDTDWMNVSSRNILYLDQANLAIPASYYMSPNLTQRYQDTLRGAIYQTAVLLNGGSVDNQTVLSQIDRMVSIEVQLAQISVPATDLRNMSTQYNPFTISQASSQFSAFNWNQFFRGTLNSVFPGVDPASVIDPFVLLEPNQYVHDLDTWLASVNSDQQKIRDLVNYLIFRLISPFLEFAGPETAQIMKDLKRSTRLDDPDITDQQQQCVAFLANNVPWGAGRVYVDYNFPSQNRDDVSVMINNVLSAFSSGLSGLDWMDNPSALRAFQKVAGLVRNVAYPDFEENDQQLDQYYDWLIQKARSIDPNQWDAWYQYTMAATAFQGQLMWQTLKLDNNRYEFLMSPAIVNAWYQPERNSITFPAGILNAPFYRYDFPQAVNYGALGVGKRRSPCAHELLMTHFAGNSKSSYFSVMGHELSHGFDDQGIQYDANGTLHTWMTPTAEAGFNAMAQCVVNEYDHFCYPQGCINGITTQGENIGDNGGLKAAYRAYQAYKASHGEEPPLPGMETYTMEQIFFLSFGQVWCGSYSDDALTRQLLTNAHSPGKDRVIGAVQNFDKFAEAFQCKKGDPMYPEHSCDVW